MIEVCFVKRSLVDLTPGNFLEVFHHHFEIEQLFQDWGSRSFSAYYRFLKSFVFLSQGLKICLQCGDLIGFLFEAWLVHVVNIFRRIAQSQCDWLIAFLVFGFGFALSKARARHLVYQISAESGSWRQRVDTRQESTRRFFGFSFLRFSLVLLKLAVRSSLQS